jgi:hypothetical protein
LFINTLGKDANVDLVKVIEAINIKNINFIDKIKEIAKLNSNYPINIL